MQKNYALVGVSGLVVAIAVVGTGWLFLRKSPPPRRPGGEKAVVAATGPKKVVPPPPPKVVKGPAPAPVAVVAPGPKPAPSVDVCGQVDTLLKEYDAVITDGGPSDGGDRIHTLRERSQRIDRIVEQLAALGIDALPCLSDQLRADARSSRIDRESIEVRAIAKIPGCKETTAALGEAFIATDAWGVKMTIVAQLAEGSCPDGLDFLCSRIEADQDFRIRGSILKFLGQKKAPCGVQAAQRLAVNDENPNVRIAALRALADAEDTGSRLVLEDRARSDGDVSVRQNAIQAYGQVMKDQGVPLLEDLLAHDANIRIKSVAILALQGLTTSEAARAVLERTAQDPNASEDVRARATGALANIDRARNGAAVPNLTGRLDALEPVNLERMKPLAPVAIDPIGGKK